MDLNIVDCHRCGFSGEDYPHDGDMVEERIRGLERCIDHQRSVIDALLAFLGVIPEEHDVEQWPSGFRLTTAQIVGHGTNRLKPVGMWEKEQEESL